MNGSAPPNLPATPATQPATPATRPASRPPRTEREFLEQETARAQAALGATWAAAQQQALGLADLGYWARRHPWPTVAASALCGWLLGSALAPRGSGAGERDDGAAPRERRASRAWVGPLLTAALQVGRFVFQNAIVSGWQAGATAAPAQPGSDVTGGREGDPAGAADD